MNSGPLSIRTWPGTPRSTIRRPSPVEDVFRGQATHHIDAQALAGELIDRGEGLQGSPVVGPVVDKDVAPAVVLRPLGPETDAGAVVQRQTATLGLFARDAQPFAAPDPLDVLVVHAPAFSLLKRRDAPVAVTPELARQFDDSRLKASCPFRARNTCRWVDRACPRTRHARRSNTPSLERTRSTALRLRRGLRSFPLRPP